MICETCKTALATVHFTQVAGETRTEEHHCELCAKATLMPRIQKIKEESVTMSVRGPVTVKSKLEQATRLLVDVVRELGVARLGVSVCSDETSLDGKAIGQGAVEIRCSMFERDGSDCFCGSSTSFPGQVQSVECAIKDFDRAYGERLKLYARPQPLATESKA